MVKEYTLIHPDIGTAEISAVTDLLKTDNQLPNIAFRDIEGGPLHLLASEFANFMSEVKGGLPEFIVQFAKRRHLKTIPLSTCCTNTATNAIYALLTVAKASGGEVITTSLNYTGVINAILMAGAVPRFVDIDKDSWCMDLAGIKGAVTKKTKAIVLTHVNKFVDVGPLCEFMERHGIDIPLIQDASLSVGSTHLGLRPGFFNPGRGSATVFSLATSKAITGLGGAIVSSNDRELIESVISYAYQGKDLKGGVNLASRGGNFRMNDINAVIALVQLQRREELFARRRRLKELYDKNLKPLIDKGKIVLQAVGPESVITQYGVLIKNRDAIAKKLYEKNRIYLGKWHVHHLQKIYKTLPWAKRARLPVTEDVGDRVAFLPFHTKLEERDVECICNTISLSVLQPHRR